MSSPSEKQLATLSSISDTILSIWIKLGEKYSEWTEANIHGMTYSRHVTATLRIRYEDYTYTEAQRAIGFLMKVKSSYQAMWNKKWRADAESRSALALEDEQIRQNCMTWEAVIEWMTRVHPFYQFVPCYFDFVKRIGRDTYWMKRDKVRPLFTRRQTEDKHKALRLDEAGWMIAKAWDAVQLPGHDGTLFELIPKLQYLLQG
ncbi:MAG: hypothetical protein M5R41_10295 [Bacteroidia bacterium]|nr:hypothetical protein [Bacteroidia bacterium]